MPRKPSKPTTPEVQQLDALKSVKAATSADLADATVERAAKNKADAAGTGYAAARDEVNQLIARHQIMDAFSKITAASCVAAAERIKRTGAWKTLVGTEFLLPNGKLAAVKTWEDFCEQCLGYSRSRIDEEIATYKRLGPEMFEAIQQAGISIRDQRELRRLPADDHEAFASEISSCAGDPEAVAATVQRFVADVRAKQEQETGQLRDQVAQLEDRVRQDREANDRVLANKEKMITELTSQIERWEGMKPAERTAEEARMLEEATQRAIEAMLLPEQAIKRIFEWADTPSSLINACAKAVIRIAEEVERIRESYGLPSSEDAQFTESDSEFRDIVSG